MSEGLHGILGATGYIGERLGLELRKRDEPVRALARTPERAHRLGAAGAEVRQADVMEPEGLDEALDGVRVLYYLVHSMGRGSNGDFAKGDEAGARNVATAAERAGVETVVRDPSGMALFDFEPAGARRAMRDAVTEFEGRA